ncbi:hypothetical protein HAX54_022221 [Datura stramonium]|uniref:Uncharacterized protein n=1 Tax=Datura stramonium TaxID=4076 RepID=A0ABS8UVU2_DATST|nr:hypothetical protein [Datura stramonium]
MDQNTSEHGFIEGQNNGGRGKQPSPNFDSARAGGIGDLPGPRLVVKQFIPAPKCPKPPCAKPYQLCTRQWNNNCGENRANVFNGNQLAAEGVNSPSVEGRDQDGASMYRGCSGVKF